jgi:hypothetical protein
MLALSHASRNSLVSGTRTIEFAGATVLLTHYGLAHSWCAREASRPDRVRDMLVEIRRNVANLKREGKTLDQVIIARPTAKFDPKWGTFVVTPAFFTRLVYRGV